MAENYTSLVLQKITRFVKEVFKTAEFRVKGLPVVYNVILVIVAMEVTQKPSVLTTKDWEKPLGAESDLDNAEHAQTSKLTISICRWNALIHQAE